MNKINNVNQYISTYLKFQYKKLWLNWKLICLGLLSQEFDDFYYIYDNLA